MVNIPKQKLYACQKIGCGWEWLQRFKVNRNEKGKIKSVETLDPKNCSKCKSPTWDIPRD